MQRITKAIKSAAYVISAALILTISFYQTSNAASFTFTGNADYGSLFTAGLFGSGSTSDTFTATMTFDDTQTPGSALNTTTGFFADTAQYAYTSFTWTLGDKSWTYNSPGPLEAVTITDGKIPLFGTDNILVNGSQNKNIGSTTVIASSVSSVHTSDTAYSGTDASNINLFNSLTGITVGSILLGNFDGIIFLSDISMRVNAVPLPAGVWLLGSAILGFIGIRRRKISK